MDQAKKRFPVRDRKGVAQCLAALAYCLFAVGAHVSATGVAYASTGEITQLMVKLRDPRAARSVAIDHQVLRGLSSDAGIALEHARRMSGNLQVMRLPRGMTPAEAAVVAARLRNHPGVEQVEVDHWVQPLSIPNDPYFHQQWNLQDAASEVAAANLTSAWQLTTGRSDLVVAIVDTGVVRHAELDFGSRVITGYDFVSSSFVANDGDGRDPDPTDPGNWVTSEDVAAKSLCTQVDNSTWHGTHVMGIIGAMTGNGVGMAGINWSSKLLPVRVLGKCGGYLSDVLDGARWAAGLAVPGVPANANPARVINMSLGSNTTCSGFIQSAIDEISAAGAVVIAAAGNGLGDAASVAPGNCSGVVAVAALSRSGNRAYYSRTGSTVALAAPGGAQVMLNDPAGIFSLLNTGTTTALASPVGDSYTYLQGTSMAAPHVAGVASLMLSVNPTLIPAQLRHKLRATARAFPSGSSCTPVLCGAGMLDAERAVRSAMNATPPIADAGGHIYADPGASISLDGSGSNASAPAALWNYTWTQLSGTPVALSNRNSASPTFIAPAWSDTLVFQLTVTDDSGFSASDTSNVAVGSGVYTASAASASSGNGGGGGGGGCYIATAAYGSASSAEVMQLRVFRDGHLQKFALGRAFVRTYYRLSPPLANAIRPYPGVRAMVRLGLKPYVTAARWFTAESRSTQRNVANSVDPLLLAPL